MMESTHQKTFRLLRAILPIPVILVIILLLSSSVFAASSFKVVRVIEAETIKIQNNIKPVTIRLIGIDAPETSRKKHEPGQPFSQAAIKHLASLVLNQFVDIKSYGTDRYGLNLG